MLSQPIKTQVDRELIGQTPARTPLRYAVPPFRAISADELAAAVLHPSCIVRDLFYADVGALLAPGGIGKTTTKLYESICIALELKVWGYRVERPGKTLIITAEDPQTLIHGRLRELMNAMKLSPAEQRIVRDCVMVWDVSGDTVRLAEAGSNGNLVITDLADQIIEQYRGEGIVQVVFDPAIRFGPGERFVNDGDDMVIIAARRIVRALDCLVQLVHHTGKQNARNGALDQYANRGGSAFSDGCRMVTVLAAINGGDDGGIGGMGGKTPPDGFELLPGDSGFIMARPKLSYTQPQPTLWIRRRGWHFEAFAERKRNPSDVLAADCARLTSFLRDELHHGRRYSKTTLEDTQRTGLRINRKRLRAALGALKARGVLLERDLPDGERYGRRKTYLHVSAEPHGGMAADGGQP